MASVMLRMVQTLSNPSFHTTCNCHCIFDRLLPYHRSNNHVLLQELCQILVTIINLTCLRANISAVDRNFISPIIDSHQCNQQWMVVHVLYRTLMHHLPMNCRDRPKILDSHFQPLPYQPMCSTKGQLRRDNCSMSTPAMFPHKRDHTSPSPYTQTRLDIIFQIVEWAAKTDRTLIHKLKGRRSLLCPMLVSHHFRGLQGVQWRMNRLDVQYRKVARSGSVDFQLNSTKLQ